MSAAMIVTLVLTHTGFLILGWSLGYVWGDRRDPGDACGYVSYDGPVCRKRKGHKGHCFTNGRPA